MPPRTVLDGEIVPHGKPAAVGPPPFRGDALGAAHPRYDPANPTPCELYRRPVRHFRRYLHRLRPVEKTERPGRVARTFLPFRPGERPADGNPARGALGNVRLLRRPLMDGHLAEPVGERVDERRDRIAEDAGIVRLRTAPAPFDHRLLLHREAFGLAGGKQESVDAEAAVDRLQPFGKKPGDRLDRPPRPRQPHADGTRPAIGTERRQPEGACPLAALFKPMRQPHEKFIERELHPADVDHRLVHGHECPAWLRRAKRPQRLAHRAGHLVEAQLYRLRRLARAEAPLERRPRDRRDGTHRLQAEAAEKQEPLLRQAQRLDRQRGHPAGRICAGDLAPAAMPGEREGEPRRAGKPGRDGETRGTEPFEAVGDEPRLAAEEMVAAGRIDHQSVRPVDGDHRRIAHRPARQRLQEIGIGLPVRLFDAQGRTGRPRIGQRLADRGTRPEGGIVGSGDAGALGAVLDQDQRPVSRRGAVRVRQVAAARHLQPLETIDRKHRKVNGKNASGHPM